jgi:hypothetical protein
MTYALLLTLARIDDVSAGGPLTLLFPLVLVPVVAGIWWLWLRNSSRKS